MLTAKLALAVTAAALKITKAAVIDPIWGKAVLKSLVLPPTGPLLLALFGLALHRRMPRIGARVAWIGVLTLLALSIPAVAALLIRSLELPAPFDRERAFGTQAIVILGGGTRHDAPEYGGDTLNTLTLERVRYGARVARETALPVLVTGGSTYGGKAEADLMRDALQHEFNIEVQWAEDRSRTTHENAVYSAEILRAAGIRRVILVAHAFDMRRATAEFAAAGIAAVPAATGIPSYGRARAFDFLPGIVGLQGSYYALYEILANAVRVVIP